MSRPKLTGVDDILEVADPSKGWTCPKCSNINGVFHLRCRECGGRPPKATFGERIAHDVCDAVAEVVAKHRDEIRRQHQGRRTTHFWVDAGTRMYFDKEFNR